MMQTSYILKQVAMLDSCHGQKQFSCKYPVHEMKGHRFAFQSNEAETESILVTFVKHQEDCFVERFPQI